MTSLVRTSTKASGPLTASERELLKLHTDKWVKNALSTERIDPSKVIPAIKDLYKVSGLSEPRVVLVPSPKVMVLAGVLAACLLEFKKHSALTSHLIRPSADSLLRTERISYQVRAALVKSDTDISVGIRQASDGLDALRAATYGGLQAEVVLAGETARESMSKPTAAHIVQRSSVVKSKHAVQLASEGDTASPIEGAWDVTLHTAAPSEEAIRFALVEATNKATTPPPATLSVYKDVAVPSLDAATGVGPLHPEHAMPNLSGPVSEAIGNEVVMAATNGMSRMVYRNTQAVNSKVVRAIVGAALEVGQHSMYKDTAGSMPSVADHVYNALEEVASGFTAQARESSSADSQTVAAIALQAIQPTAKVDNLGQVSISAHKATNRQLDDELTAEAIRVQDMSDPVHAAINTAVIEGQSKRAAVQNSLIATAVMTTASTNLSAKLDIGKSAVPQADAHHAVNVALTHEAVLISKHNAISRLTGDKTTSNLVTSNVHAAVETTPKVEIAKAADNFPQVQAHVSRALHNATREAVSPEFKGNFSKDEAKDLWAAADATLRLEVDQATELAETAPASDTVESALEKALPPDWYYQLCLEYVSPLLANEVINSLSYWSNCCQSGNMWSAYPCYLSAFRDVLKLTGLSCWEKFAPWEQCAIEGGYRFMHTDFCMVSDRPTVLKLDAENRPHCEDGPTHLWSDGWALYHWHGVSVPKEWILEKSSLSAKTALTWDNIEQRRAACEIVGWAKILKELNARVIDADDDPEIGTLLEVDLPDSGKERFIQVVCGTGRSFALPVPRSCKTALQANAWTYGLDGETYRPEVRT